MSARAAATKRAGRAGLVGVLIGVCLAASGFRSLARADVLEIGAGGTVVVYSRPTVFTAAGAAPILASSPQDGSVVRADLSSAIAESARRHAVSPALLEAVAWRESRFRQAAISPRGAIGVMQLMAGTARDMRINPYDLRQNVDGGAAYLSRMMARYRGDAALALAAYNAGPGAVDSHGGIPPFEETRRYVSDIIKRLAPAPDALPSQSLIFGP